ncbi:sigma-70 family RNA polymerase sigma factor [Burkholderia cepacia]|uniref:sigma-70 family RNA polymerase sigma factor n=1 Tax=Burkholderia cepacia TaxID=292 RepID=UPI00249EE620|nr:sigma-70 family RNA polymerase sigma factor [Burkholderia cepacia]WGY70495.1 sigma-70 family RNA polymerase sigma factor [Burkholderia cepacia]
MAHASDITPDSSDNRLGDTVHTRGNPAFDGSRPTSESERRRREELNQFLLDVAAGDQDAFGILYRRTSAKLFGVCLTILRDRGEAEEVLQDVYVTVWRRAATFDPALASAITWLGAIARNRAIDRLRRHREAPVDESTMEETADEQPSPAAVAEHSEARRRLEYCLENLPAAQGSVVREAFFAGATYAELAEHLRVPLGTLKSWIRRSLIQLKACLER